ncbi:M12 family metallopeptidase [Pseudomonas sp. NPDC087804]|uniref:M12 family metallopeptidase n=1 Tax=Pseudomonas sp. NPDC087804 TaxID=3364449 RepID=UPI00381251D6
MKQNKPCSIIRPHDESASHHAALRENPANTRAPNAMGHGIRATGYFKKFWRAGRTLRVRFLDPHSHVEKMVYMAGFWEWQRYANIDFQLSEDEDAEIRIRTVSDDSCSTIGTDALIMEESEATLYLAIPIGEEGFMATLRHEIGHVLGFEHEHMHRDANIPWNKEKVYAYYLEEHAWDKERVDHNILNTVDPDIVADTDYDTTSIMHYDVDAELTDGVFEVGENNELSEKDIKAARYFYPKDPDSVPWKDLLDSP